MKYDNLDKTVKVDTADREEEVIIIYITYYNLYYLHHLINISIFKKLSICYVYFRK